MKKDLILSTEYCNKLTPSTKPSSSSTFFFFFFSSYHLAQSGLSFCAVVVVSVIYFHFLSPFSLSFFSIGFRFLLQSAICMAFFFTLDYWRGVRAIGLNLSILPSIHFEQFERKQNLLLSFVGVFRFYRLQTTIKWRKVEIFSMLSLLSLSVCI